MGRLIYSAITSLDGYVADREGNFDWAMPDEELHRFANELERGVGTHLYGRRMYETMVWWEHPEGLDDGPDYVREYAEIWQAAKKIVYSTTLPEVSSADTTLEREFDPAAVQRLKESSERDLSIGGPGLAAAALHAGLVDEVVLMIVPAIVGGGNAALPDGLRRDLVLLDERRVGNGAVTLRYGLAGDGAKG
jgi:dihydrofolate reductase